ncbi:MAG: hypothetical protein OJF49_000807 [Ktedonobacterales bacterium]|jgi:hypothetical protein|nr:MAG: hypothetical protein OJF49_000807 [Ktedonobacterales bacterium]
MHDLLTTALVGTAQAGAVSPTTDTEVDTLTEQLPADDAERRLLLTAGAAAMYALAGYVPEMLAATPEPASAETLPACSPGTTVLLRDLLANRQGVLLPEALARLQNAGLRLPPDLLPLALDVREPASRGALIPVLGERGRWLSQFNPAWSWARDALTTGEANMPAAAETVWQEGTPGQRHELLKLLRATDPAKARDWLQAAWKQEKADVRREFLSALSINLGPDDEAFLETALDDRSTTVRDTAANLLMRLPTSAFIARMIARADPLLSYADGALDVEIPSSLDPAASRDGVPGDSLNDAGHRVGLLIYLLGHVPPVHWQERFSLDPAAFVAAVENSLWPLEALEGLARAAALFDDQEWALPLWRYWSAPRKADTERQVELLGELPLLLAPHVPHAEWEAWALHMLAEASDDQRELYGDIFAWSPSQWSRDFGDGYLAALRAFIAGLNKKSKSAEPWDDTLESAALALPPECFAAALASFDLPEDNTTWQIQNFRRQLDAFADTIRVRQRIYDEIPVADVR